MLLKHVNKLLLRLNNVGKMLLNFVLNKLMTPKLLNKTQQSFKQAKALQQAIQIFNY